MLDETQRLALETLQKNKQALVFAPSRASAEKTAEEIAKLTALQYPELEKDILTAVSSPTKQCRKLSHCVRKGIAFHHAGLVEKQRELIEKEFREGKIKIICCTPTLAAGISTPAFRVIIKSLKRYSGQWGMDWIPVLEYMQMSGRAGRPEYESFGEAITVAKNESEKEEIYERYICGEPEEIFSKLNAEPVLRTYLLSLVSSGIIRDEKSMKDFFRRTFWAHKYGDMKQLEGKTAQMLGLLSGWGFVKIVGEEFIGEKKDDFISASQLGKTTEKKFRPTMLGKRISELYLDPLTARHLLDCLNNWQENKKAFSLLQAICHTLEMRPLLRTKSKEQDFIQEELVKRYGLLLEEEPSAYDLEYSEFMDSIKTALFFEDWINENDEDFLLEKHGIRPGEIRGKIEIADWLLYACGELSKIGGLDKEMAGRESVNRALVKEIAKLRIRVKNGVKEELLPLLKLKGIGRVRARRLVNNRLKDLDSLKKIDLASLSQILGRAVAEDVKKQLGEEVKEIPAGKRKGQMSIEKF